MRYGMAFCCCLAVVAAAPALGATDTKAGATCTSLAVDSDAAAFFTNLKAGEVMAALQGTLGKSPMLEGRASDLETLARQIQVGIDTYGPVRNQECVREMRLGTMLVRREYLAQHDKMLTRWTMIFTRLPAGWRAVQVSYEDQVGTWTD